MENTMSDLEIPGGPIATRPLHFIFVCDCSGSMAGEKIGSLNQAIREALPHMCEVARGNPNAELMVRAVRFSNGAQWHVSQATPVEQFRWTDLQAGGQTDMGQAMHLLADVLKTPPMAQRALPPVLVLVSDGQPTDTFATGLKALMDEPWGKRAVRIAIAIGGDPDLDVLRKFIGHAEVEPLVAHNAPDLVRYIRWASTAVIQAASSPASQSAKAAPTSQNVPLPPAPAASAPGVNDVW